MKISIVSVLGAATITLAQKGKGGGGSAAGVKPTGPYKDQTSYWVEPGLAKNTIFAPKDVPNLKLPVRVQITSSELFLFYSTLFSPRIGVNLG
jgi:hypothetical protein